MLRTTRHCVTQDCYITSEAVAKLQSKASQHTDLSITSSEQSSDQVGMWAAIAVEWERPCYVHHLNSQSYTIPKMWLTRASRVTAISWHTRLLPAQNNNEKRTSYSNWHYDSCSTIYLGDIKEKLLSNPSSFGPCWFYERLVFVAWTAQRLFDSSPARPLSHLPIAIVHI
jgi:hypothetical protein